MLEIYVHKHHISCVIAQLVISFIGKNRVFADKALNVSYVILYVIVLVIDYRKITVIEYNDRYL